MKEKKDSYGEFFSGGDDGETGFRTPGLKAQIQKAIEELGEDGALILEFVQDLQIAGITAGRLQRYLITLRMVKKWVNKPFQEWGEKELKQVLLRIENNGYTVQTINEYRKGLRKLFRWLKGNNWEPLDLLKGDRKDNRKPDFLTEEEILQSLLQDPLPFPLTLLRSYSAF